MAFFRHFRALLNKNITLRKRDWKISLTEALLPVFLTWVIVVVRVLSVSPTDPSAVDTYEMQSVPIVPSFIQFHTKTTDYENICNFDHGDHIAVAPVELAKEFIQYVAALQNSVDRHDDVRSHFFAYESLATVAEVIEDPLYPSGNPRHVPIPRGPPAVEPPYHQNSSSICAAIEFHPDEENPRALSDYTIQANLTTSLTLPYHFAERQKAYAEGEGRKGLLAYNKAKGMIIQTVVDNFLMFRRIKKSSMLPPLDQQSILANTMSTFAVSPLTMLTSPYETFVMASGTLIPIIFFLSFTFSVGRVCAALTGEKETRMREALRMAGVGEAAFYLAWLLDFTTMFTFAATLCSWFAKVMGVVKYADYLWLWVIFEGFALSSMAFAFLLSAFFSHAKTAAVSGSVLFFMGASLTGLIKINSPLIAKTLASFVPPLGLNLCLRETIRLANSGEGTNLDTVFNSPDPSGFTIAIGASCLWASIPLFLMLGVYLDMVLPSQFGPKKHPLFFLGVGKARSTPVAAVEQAANQQSLLDGIAEEGLYATGMDVEPPSAAQAEQIRLQQCVSIRGLTKIFREDSREVRAVDGVDLDLYKGEISVLLGHNGAGKSTTIGMLTALMPPTSGTIQVFNHSMPRDTPLIRTQLGVCPQHDTLWPNMTVQEHFDLFAKLKLPPGGDEATATAQAQELMAQVGLAAKKNSFSSQLSGGMQRKLSVALAFVGNPSLVVLDEPTSGMDPYARRALWSMLRGLKAGRVVLMTTHYMDEADALGDRVAVMAAGKVRCAGSPLFLKQRFGCGYRLVFNRAPPRIIRAQIEEHDAAIAREPELIKEVDASLRAQEAKQLVKEGKMTTADFDRLREGWLTEARKEAVTSGVALAIQQGLEDPKIAAADVAESEQSRERLLAFLYESFPSLEILTDIANDLEVRADFDDAPLFADVFTQLEKRRGELGVTSYGVSVSSLEEVFIKIAEGEDEDEEAEPEEGDEDDEDNLMGGSFYSNARKNTGSVVEVARQLARSIQEAPTNTGSVIRKRPFGGSMVGGGSMIGGPAEQVAEADDRPLLEKYTAAKKAADESTAKKQSNADLKGQKAALNAYEREDELISRSYDRSSGLELLSTQFFGLLEKRWRFFRRDTRSILCQLLLPLTIILVGMVFRGVAVSINYADIPTAISTFQQLGGFSHGAPMRLIYVEDPTVKERKSFDLIKGLETRLPSDLTANLASTINLTHRNWTIDEMQPFIDVPIEEGGSARQAKKKRIPKYYHKLRQLSYTYAVYKYGDAAKSLFPETDVAERELLLISHGKEMGQDAKDKQAEKAETLYLLYNNFMLHGGPQVMQYRANLALQGVVRKAFEKKKKNISSSDAVLPLLTAMGAADEAELSAMLLSVSEAELPPVFIEDLDNPEELPTFDETAFALRMLRLHAEIDAEEAAANAAASVRMLAADDKDDEDKKDDLDIPAWVLTPLKTGFQVLPLTAEQKKNRAVVEAMSVGMFVHLALIFIPVGVVALAVREKQIGFKFQQFVTGCKGVAYWTAHTVFDYFFYILPGGLTFLLLEYFEVETFVGPQTRELLMNALIVYGFAAVTQANLLSFLFKEYSNAMTSVLSVNLVLGVIGAMICFILDFLGLYKNQQYLVDASANTGTVLRALSPAFSLGRVLLVIPKCKGLVGDNAEEGREVVLCDPNDWEEGGQEIYAMLGYGALYFLASIIIDSSNSFFGSAPVTEQLTEEEKAVDAEQAALLEDADVLVEKHRVQSLSTAQRDAQAIVLNDARKTYHLTNSKIAQALSSTGKKPKRAVRGVSMAVSGGEILGLLGVNGAGKTSTMKLICAAETPTGGSVHIAGRSVVDSPVECRARLGYCPQHDAQLPLLTADEHLTLFAKLRGLKAAKDTPESRLSANAFLRLVVDEKLQQTGLVAQAAARAGSLSGGNRRRLSIAMATVGEPPIVLLDEPSCGLDPVARRALWTLIRRIARAKHATAASEEETLEAASASSASSAVILTTHSMEEAEALSQRVAIMVDGRVRCLGSATHLKNVYGEGFTLSVRCPPPSSVEVRALTDALLIEAKAASLITRNAAGVPIVDRAALKTVMTLLLERAMPRKQRDAAQKNSPEERLATLFEEQVIEVSEGRSALEQTLEAEGALPVPQLSEWWLNSVAVLKSIAAVMHFFPGARSHAPDVRGALVEFTIERQPRETLAMLFGLLQKARGVSFNEDGNLLGECALSQTTLEQVFHKFAHTASSNVQDGIDI